MKLKELESNLQEVETFSNPKLNYEQYITTPHLASRIIFTINNTYDDINQSRILDLGIGTGMLSIGCLLEDADFVTGVDIDLDALAQCKSNMNKFDFSNCELINANCKQLLASNGTLFREKFDTILMNPPFGTKYQTKSNDSNSNELGVDMQFLKLASKLSTRVIYSLNKSCTRNYIKKTCVKWGLEMEVVNELRYNIPKVVKCKNARECTYVSVPDKDIQVDFLRFTFIE